MGVTFGDDSPSVAIEVSESLAEAPVLPRDRGAVALALRYAGLLDRAALPSKYRAPLQRLRRLVERMGDERDREAFTQIADALSEHSTASDLGPKLLAVLTALGMTVAGRSAKGGSSDERRVVDELAELRERAAARKQRGVFPL